MSLRWISAVFLLWALVGCGFKLRGPVEMPFETVYVGGHAFEPVVRELSHRLRESRSVTVVDRVEDAERVITIIGADRDDEVLSLGRTGHVLQYEYTLTVRYRLCGPKGRSCRPDDRIELRRQMTYDESQILAKQNEERFLQRDMNQEAARLLLLRMSRYQPDDESGDEKETVADKSEAVSDKP